MEHSSEVKWYTDREEYFSLLGRGWDITKAKKIIIDKPREIFLISTVSFEPLIGGKTASGTIRMGISIDSSKATSEEIDLSIPVIIVETSYGDHMLIDGWHRLAKAVHIKQELLPAVILSPEENVRVSLR
jgi:hypothetical protein